MSAGQLLARTDTFIFDCDGVLYTPEGPVEGVAEALASLRAAGKRCFFVTNNSTATRQQLQATCAAHLLPPQSCPHTTLRSPCIP